MGPRLLTVNDVAAYYRVTPRTVRDWVKKGVLKPVRTPGGRLRFLESALPKMAAGRNA